MRLYLIPILFGLLGVTLFLCAISVEDFPDSLSSLTLPGLMVAFALIHGSEGAADWLALAAGAAVQFVLFAVVGMLVAAASRPVQPLRRSVPPVSQRRGRESGGTRSCEYGAASSGTGGESRKRNRSLSAWGQSP